MLKVISKHKDKAQVVLVNGGKPRTQHLKLDKKTGKYVNSRGIPFLLPVFVALMMFFGASPINAQVKARIINGNYQMYPSVQEYKNTGRTFTDAKGNQYPVYVSSRGKLFIFKFSAKTGKPYKSYLKV